MMIICSHNTMTFMQPRKWWMRLFMFCARCQNDMRALVDCEAVDIRLSYVDGRFCFAHGLVQFGDLLCPVAMTEHIIELVEHTSVKAIRLILENARPTELAEEAFKQVCKVLEAKLSKRSIRCFGGICKAHWEVIYDFEYKPTCNDCYGSVSKQWYGKVWPWLWHKLHSKDIEASKADNSYDILLLDFVS